MKYVYNIKDIWFLTHSNFYDKKIYDKYFFNHDKILTL